ncbi:heme o synthase [Flavobacteriaceae bacterium]|nr:heme o synthase [Flavobacteriaceae bacterium]
MSAREVVLETPNESMPKQGVLVVFKEITKMRLAISVVFSAVAGYLLAAETVSFSHILLLSLGGYAMVGASNAFNQVIEKDLDALMNRTANRPIPTHRISTQTALIIASLLTVLGLVSLYVLSPKTAMFGAVSIFLYTSVYTPLKTITPLAVFVGAIPGAIPFMLGWVSETNSFGIEPGTLFMIQFFWQFPHFWSLAWLLDEDYQRGGFKMLPTGKKDKKNGTPDHYVHFLDVGHFCDPCFRHYGTIVTFNSGSYYSWTYGCSDAALCAEAIRQRRTKRSQSAYVGQCNIYQLVANSVCSR